ncbi:MAG TPA: hypothetical protein VKB95_06985 [Chitinophagaceae bacterium]|nr:hypothetical protein [Chitinophagaceae bacterium]
MKRQYFILFAFAAFTLSITSCGNKGNDKNQVTDTTNNTDSATPTDSLAVEVVSSGPIAIDNLPASVKPYVEKNFAGYTISNAAHDPLCSGGDAIDVVITKPGQINLSLIFKPDGTFVQKEEDVPLNTAPVKVRDLVKRQYADYKASNQIEKLTLANNTTEYLIDITKGNVSKEVIMTNDGKVVCEN